MSVQNRYCVDVISPGSLSRINVLSSRLDLDANDLIVMRAIMPIVSVWPNGSVLRVRFLGGSVADKETVKNVASEWTRYANIKLEFNDSPQAEIRVSFIQDGQSWSYVGTDCLNIPSRLATMNFGWSLDSQTILHEFGHALGLAHEHQNPAGGIQWNVPVVIRDLSGPPNSWDAAAIKSNVLDKYTNNQIHGTRFDDKSIMLYAFPAEWTLDGFQAGWNEAISDLDKQFIGERYPATRREVPELEVIDLSGTPGAITAPGVENLYRFTAITPGSHTVETSGPTDVVMKLFGPDSGTRLVAEDDDSGAQFNSKIVSYLTPGEYLIQIRHFNANVGRGDYHIRVVKSS